MAVGINAAPALTDRLPIMLTVVLWASQVPVLHDVGARWDPLTLNVVRYCLAGIVFAAILAMWPPERQAMRTADSLAAKLVIGALFSGFGILFTTATIVGSPVVIVTTAAVMPLTASLVNWAVVGVRPARAMLLALTLVVPGAILTTTGGPPDGDTLGSAVGAALLVIAQACWALYSLRLPRLLPGRTAVERTQFSVVWSLPFQFAALGLALLFGFARADVETAPAWDAAMIVIATLGPLVVGVLLWNVSVERIGLPLSALFLNLIPVVGVAVSTLYGVVPDTTQLVGIALVVAGMALGQGAGRSRLRA